LEYGQEGETLQKTMHLLAFVSPHLIKV